jgi:hypothetical protein
MKVKMKAVRVKATCKMPCMWFSCTHILNNMCCLSGWMADTLTSTDKVNKKITQPLE